MQLGLDLEIAGKEALTSDIQGKVEVEMVHLGKNWETRQARFALRAARFGLAAGSMDR